MHRRSYTFTFFVLLMGLLMPSALQAKRTELDTLKEKCKVFQKCHFNFDKYKDTLLVEKSNGCYLLRAIVWGKDTSDKNSKYTTIEYPNWENLTEDYLIVKSNKDSLSDLVIMITGDKKIKNKTSDTPDSIYKKMYKNVLLFGQNQLTSLKKIKIKSIDSIQYTPFVAIDLDKLNGFKNFGKRDNSLNISCTLQKFNIDVNAFATASKEASESSQTTLQTETIIDIFPNPTDYEISFRSNTGIKSIEIANNLGQIVYKEQFSSKDIENDFQVNCSNFANGLYIIKAVDAKYDRIVQKNIIINH